MKSHTSPFSLLVLTLFLSGCMHSNSALTPVTPSEWIVTQVSANDISETTYTDTITYDVPHGETTTEFTVTTSPDDIITEASAQMISGDHESRAYQERFNRNLTNKVVGKKISELNLNVISGASLTTEAFEHFIQKNL